MAVDGLGIAYAAAGGVLLAAGYRGARVSDAFRAVLDGQPVPSGSLAVSGYSGGASLAAGVPVVSSGSTSDFVRTATRYDGARYVWGGVPGTTVGVDNGTDCSGFVNMVIGRDLGLAIPGYAAGAFSGSAHGPATLSWNTWKGVQHLGTYGAAGVTAEPGDLLMWATHIGFYVGAGNMFSALGVKWGVTTSPAATSGPTGEGSPIVGRYVGAS